MWWNLTERGLIPRWKTVQTWYKILLIVSGSHSYPGWNVKEVICKFESLQAEDMTPASMYRFTQKTSSLRPLTVRDWNPRFCWKAKVVPLLCILKVLADLLKIKLHPDLVNNRDVANPWLQGCIKMFLFWPAPCDKDMESNPDWLPEIITGH